jgi:lipoyl(octanoyl) transferase
MSLPVFKDLGLADYQSVWDAMRSFTELRDAHTPDEIWLVEHPPVFTLGMNADPAHVLSPGDIPVVQIDRGGQVTYHGPGQLVVYPLLALKRYKLGVRDLICALERAVIDLLAQDGIEASGRREAPGVYVAGEKIASVGLRIRRGCSYHGMAINVDMDTQPFQRINPCGFTDLRVTQTSLLGGAKDVASLKQDIQPYLLEQLCAAKPSRSGVPTSSQAPS